MKHFFTMLVFGTSILIAQAQQLTQTIRGTVYDQQAKMTLPGVGVQVVINDTSKATTTDNDGRFKINDVPIGRVTIKFTYLGYKPITLNNLIVTSSKELILNIEMEESVEELEEVVIQAVDKKGTVNQMTSVSARQFSVEETQRYAGSLGDPSRMATNFAGVATAGDTRNDIIIRGNSPLGLLWRMDGVNIPNPNHFGSLGTTGGPVSILNNNLLANSDFMTGAFPAGYGNAMSGAFDLRMRTGNNEKREFLGQIGFNGFEAGAEGPLGKSNKGSYLINYRYSTLGAFKAMGLNIGYGNVPQYQDIAYKIEVPLGEKSGKLSFFGIGGKSYIELLAKDKGEDDFSVTGAKDNTYFGSNMGVTGVSHTYFFNENTRQVITLAASGTQNIIKVDSLYNDLNDKKRRYGNNSSETKYSLVYNIRHKVSAKNTLVGGFFADVYKFNYSDSVWAKGSYYQLLSDFTGSSTLFQGYTQWQHKFTDKLTLNNGIHYQYFALNGAQSIEPRVGLKWQFKTKHSVNIGTGLHSQTLPMVVYFQQTRLNDGSYLQTNKNLNFSRSIHAVAGYDLSLGSHARFKFETYYQHLYNIPIEQRNSYYSSLNIGADFGIANIDSLKNSGLGRNYGIELTLERFLYKNFYYLVTASFYESKYQGSDGEWRNTAFNGNYVVNALAGTEFNLDNHKRKVLTINTRLVNSGGRRYLPILLDESRKAGEVVYDYKNAYQNRYDAYFRLDLKIGFKLNGRKTTQEWALDAQNITAHKNIFQQIYDPGKGDIKTEYQLGFFPMVTYRITF